MTELPCDSSAADNLSRKTLRSLQRLGAMRDAFIVGASVTYVLGYIVWSLNALHFNLGLLPAIDAQYLIAGVVPTAALAVVYGIYWAGLKLREILDEHLPHDVVGARFAFRALLLGLCSASFLVILLWPQQVLGQRYHHLELYVKWGSVAVFLVTLFLLPPVHQSIAGRGNALEWFTAGHFWASKEFLRFYRTATTAAVSVLMFGGSLYLCALALPHIPQEVGGLKERCAQMDIVADSFATNTVAKLMADMPRPPPSGSIVGTETLRVLFVGSDFIMVKPSRGGGNFWMELRMANVQSIEWRACPEKLVDS